MKNTTARVLFIESSTKKNKILIQMLTILGYNVFTVSNVEEAIHKTITLPPDIIICNEDFEEYNGFQIYTMLENQLLKRGIPFILLLNEYDRECIAMGEELGVDGFLIPPFELTKVKNILNKRLLKNEVQKSLALRYFQEIWDLIPLGFFIVENKRIINGNCHFNRFLGENGNLTKKYFLNEIFYFDTNQSEKNRLLRFLNGIEKSCSFKNIQVNNKGKESFNISLFYLDNHISALSMMGIIFPYSNNSSNDNKSPEELNSFSEIDYNEILTHREKQILELSAGGIPIKLIAQQLGISIRTVEKHRSNIIQKTNAGNIIEAIVYAKKYQLIEQ